MPRQVPAAVLASIALHCMVLAAAAVRPAPAALGQGARDALDAPMRKVRDALEAKHRRVALIARARSELAAGRLRLGAFLLEGNQLDAIEAGLSFDLALASNGYAERVDKLGAALATRSLIEAVPVAFGDLKYIGRPGGMMAEALADRGGSCEQLTLLIAAAAYDSGHRQVGLRFYGGPGPHGAAHVAPVLSSGAREHDLVAGMIAARGGVRLEPEELIEVYARAHGLSAREPHAKAATSSAPNDGGNRLSLLAGFPSNTDIFPGELPLYAARAVRAPQGGELSARGDARQPEPMLEAYRCGYFVRMAALDPPVVHVDPNGSGDWIAVEPRRIPSAERLEAQASMLRQAWQVASDRSTRPADRMMAHACVAALGELSSIDFALAGEPELSREAMRMARGAKQRGTELVGRWSHGSESERASIRDGMSEYAGRTWLLLLLQGGETIVMDLLSHAEARGWGKVSLLAGQIVWPATRRGALELIKGYPLDDQVDVMHEMYHAHDDMAPWASDFDMEIGAHDPNGGEFLRGWRVFRGLAWRIWNGRRPVGELLDALLSESAGAGLRPPWQAAFMEYAARNILGLQAMRSTDLTPVRQLKTAAQTIIHPTMTLLSRRLAFIEAQGELTGPSLADAWQMK